VADPGTARLEASVLELGTELYRLRAEFESIREFRDQFIGVMKGLKHILDEKGLINLEDFEAAVALGEVLEQFALQEDAYEYEKKSGH
jgi:hypothetical protein